MKFVTCIDGNRISRCLQWPFFLFMQRTPLYCFVGITKYNSFIHAAMQDRIKSLSNTPPSLNKWRCLYILSHYDLTIDVNTDDKWIWCLNCIRHAATGQTGPTSLLHSGTTSLSQAALCYKMPHCVWTPHFQATLQKTHGEWCCSSMNINTYRNVLRARNSVYFLFLACVNSQDEKLVFCCFFFFLQFKISLYFFFLKEM